MFNEQEYNKELKIISIEKANKLGLQITIPVFLAFTVSYVLIHDIGKEQFYAFFSNFPSIKIMTGFFLFFAAMLLGIALHELIHGITWALFAKNGFKSIRFGVLWKMLTPYCHCTEPLKIKHYLLGAVTPAVFLGLIPAIAGIVTADYAVTFFGIFFLIAAIGDFMIIRLLWNENWNDYAQDHPSEAGCYVYRKR